MKKKQLIYFGIGLVVVAALVLLVLKLMRSSNQSDEQIAAINFEISDTSAVDRVIIREPGGAVMELLRNGNAWTDKKGDCVDQHMVENVLEGAKNIRFKGYVPASMEKKIIREMITSAIEVEYFSGGELLKKWYIGSNTPDHYGTYMLLETAGGKSDLPIIAEIKGLQGIIAPRYVADSRKWTCTNVLALEIREIAEVDVRNFEHPERSFKVEKSGNRFRVTSNGRPYPAIDTNMVLRYLTNFKKVHYNLKNFELTDKQVDSVKRSQPFTILTVKDIKGATTKLRMFHRKRSDELPSSVDAYGEPTPWDENNLWLELPSGDLVKAQFFVFGPLIEGRLYWETGV